MLSERSLKEAILRKVPIRGLVVKIDGDNIILRGSCAAYYYKQVAQEALKPLVADRSLNNLISVDREAGLAKQLD